jgi:hypothetical protein
VACRIRWDGTLVPCLDLLGQNRVNFAALYGREEIHPGLIIFVPNVVPRLQRELFRAALRIREPLRRELSQPRRAVGFSPAQFPQNAEIPQNSRTADASMNR